MLTEINKIIIKLTSAAFLFALFIGGHTLDYQLVLLLIGFVIVTVRNKDFQFKSSKLIFLIIAFYLMHVVASLYSKNKDIALFDLEVKASLIVFPLVFLFISKTLIKNKDVIFKLFIIISAIISLFLISNALYNFIILKEISAIIYSNFSILLHPSYYAMYLVFAIIVSAYGYSKFICKKQIIPIIAILINLIALLLSDSKSGFVSGFFVFIYLLVSYLYKRSKPYTVLSILGLLILGFVLINTNQRLQIMFNVTESYQETISNPNTYKESTGLRILSWNATVETIKENPIFGVGTGDIKPELLKKYEKLNYQKNIDIKMNVHNQFLETWLGQGVFGFVLLLLVFIIPFIDAIKRKNIILQTFLVLMFINFLFESMLNTQAGTIFFGFFYSFLVVVNYEE